MSRLTPEERAKALINFIQSCTDRALLTAYAQSVIREAEAEAIRDALRERDAEWARAYRQTSGEAIRALMDDAEKGGGR